MEITKITKRSPVGNIKSPSDNRKLSISTSSSNDECNRIAVISASIPPPNVPKKTTPAYIYILEHSKQY